MFRTTLATGVILLFFWPGLVPTHVQNKQRVFTGDDPHGLKVFGMPKAIRKYRITDLPSGTKLPPEYSACGNGVYHLKEKVRGVDITAVMVHFPAEGDFELGGLLPPNVVKPGNQPAFGSYVPPGWVALTFTLLPDAYTLQEVRLIRAFPGQSVTGIELRWDSGLVKDRVRVDRSWVDKDPYVTWEILPESQLSHLIFRIRLPKSTKDCLQKK